MSIKIQFSQEDWQRTEQNWEAWWAGELDRALIVFESFHIPQDTVQPETPAFVTNLPLDMPLKEIVDLYETSLGYIRWHGDAFPRWWPNFGPGVIAAFLGAKVGIQPDTVWFDPVEDKAPAEMHFEIDRENPWLQRILNLTKIAADRWGKSVSVGVTDIGGNLDILASMRSTEKLLIDTVDCPEQVERLANEITSAWVEFYEDFYAATQSSRGCSCWPAIWAPSRFYMLQCDFSYMISPQMFERFIIPDLTACCDHLDFSFYHLDGKGALGHLDHLLSIENLHGIQWIPGADQPDAADWPEVLSKIRQAGKLCQVLATPEDAKKIVRQHGGKGFMLHITSGKEKLTEESFPDFLRELERENMKQKRMG